MNDERFPKTYIDRANDRLQGFQFDIEGAIRAGNGANEGVMDTGTTIIGLVGKDRKFGIIASDGRISMGHRSFEEDFKKVFDCRTGFIGAAGELGLIQNLIPVFRVDLASISDSRGELMTAAGASRRLFAYYSQIARMASKKGVPAPLALVALFWDVYDETCHLYELKGGSFLPHQDSASVGSGSDVNLKEIRYFNPSDYSSKEELIDEARRLLREVPEVDQGTNNRMFYGVVDNGNFETGEEEVV